MHDPRPGKVRGQHVGSQRAGHDSTHDRAYAINWLRTAEQLYDVVIRVGVKGRQALRLLDTRRQDDDRYGQEPTLIFASAPPGVGEPYL